MPDTTEPPGRRANGLPASDWGALVDLDPRLSEGLLDRLAAAGVAAYVEPASAVDNIHRGVTMPPRPLDRLWVDPSRADQAREVVASEVADLTALLAEDDPGATAHGLVHPVPRTAACRVLTPPTLPGPPVPPLRPESPFPPALPAGGPQVPAQDDEGPVLPVPPSDDDVFAQLVASFHSGEVYTREPGAPGRPASDDLRGPAGEPRRRRTDPPPAPPVQARRPPVPAVEPDPAVEPELPGWVEPAALEDDGHFVPPPPPPVPRLRARTLAAVLAVVLGLVVLFVPQLLLLPATQFIGVCGLGLLAGGAAAMVWWMRDRSDDGPDDGAVV